MLTVHIVEDHILTHVHRDFTHMSEMHVFPVQKQRISFVQEELYLLVIADPHVK